MTNRYHPYRHHGRAPTSLPAILRRAHRKAARAHTKLAPGHRLKVTILRSWNRDAFELCCERCYVESLRPPEWHGKNLIIPLGSTRSLAIVDGVELYRAGPPRIPRAWRSRRPR